MDKASRDDIINEIQSYQAESGFNLFERFGTPEKMAEKYLDGEVLPVPITKTIGGIGKKVFLWFGATMVILIGLSAFIIWELTDDDFNYSDESADELSSDLSKWSKLEWSSNINLEINQGQASVYWHDESTVRWHCKGDNQPQKPQNDQLRFRHAQCIVFLPKQAASISIDQGQVVIVRPQASITVQVKQSELRIAENDNQYRYEIRDNDSQVASFESHDDAKHKITIVAQESTIKHYQYR